MSSDRKDRSLFWGPSSAKFSLAYGTTLTTETTYLLARCPIQSPCDWPESTLESDRYDSLLTGCDHAVILKPPMRFWWSRKRGKEQIFDEGILGFLHSFGNLDIHN